MYIKVSVIVPVYNVEKYLKTCINSLINQTYKNYEIILVDDGSQDNCPDICDYYANSYEFINSIHKKNGGLSDARNFGLNFATGDYVSFVDSDDYVSEDYLESLINLKLKYNADICVGGLYTFHEGEIPNISKNVKTILLSSYDALEHMFYQNMLDTSACAMLIPIKIAKKNLFPIGKYHEDEFTTYKYYASIDNVAITTKSVYFYLQRSGSIMHIAGKACMDELDAADNLVTECEKKWPNLKKAAQSKKFSDYCQVLLRNKNLKDNNVEVYQRIIKYLNSVKYSIIFNQKTRLKNRIAAILLIFGANTLNKVNELINSINTKWSKYK